MDEVLSHLYTYYVDILTRSAQNSDGQTDAASESTQHQLQAMYWALDVFSACNNV